MFINKKFVQNFQYFKTKFPEKNPQQCAKFLCKHSGLTASIVSTFEVDFRLLIHLRFSRLRLMQSEMSFLSYLNMSRGCGKRKLRPNGERYVRCVCLRLSPYELYVGINIGERMCVASTAELFSGWKSQLRERQTYFFIPLVCERVHTRST